MNKEKVYCKDCIFAKNSYFFGVMFDSKCNHSDNWKVETSESHTLGIIKNEYWGIGFNFDFHCERFKPRTLLQKIIDCIIV